MSLSHFRIRLTAILFWERDLIFPCVYECPSSQQGYRRVLGFDFIEIFKLLVWRRHGRYYRYRLDIVRLAGLSLSISIDFSHPWVSVSVSVSIFHIPRSQSQYRFFKLQSLNMSLSWNFIVLCSKSLSISLSIVRLSGISLSLSIENCDFQVSVSVSVSKILISKSQSQSQYRNKSFQSLSLSIELKNMVSSVSAIFVGQMACSRQWAFVEQFCGIPLIRPLAKTTAPKQLFPFVELKTS